MNGKQTSTRKDLVRIAKGFEFERVSARIQQEHRGLLADLSDEAHVRLDQEADAALL